MTTKNENNRVGWSEVTLIVLALLSRVEFKSCQCDQLKSLEVAIVINQRSNRRLDVSML